MADKQKRPGRRDYLNNFKMDDSGKYAYRGSYMAYTNGEESWKKDLTQIWICCAVPIVLLVILGFLPHSGLDGNLIVLLPYGLGIVALFVLVWKVARLTHGGLRLRKYVYDATVKVLPGYAAAVIITAAFALVGIIITLILGSFQGTIFSFFLFIAGQLCAGFGGVFIQRITRQMNWSET